MRRLFASLLGLALAVAPLGTASAAPAPRPQEVLREDRPLVPSPRPPLLVGEITTENFRIAYTARSEPVARDLAERLEEVRKQFREQLGRDWPGVTEVRIGDGRAEFEAIAIPGAPPPRWAAAVAYPSQRIVVLESGSLMRTEGAGTVVHELSHAALGQLGGEWPRWFQEGLAMHFSGDRYSFATYLALARAVATDRVASFDELSRAWPSHVQQVEEAYAQSLSFVEFLLDAHGPNAMGELLDRVSAGERFDGAFASAFGATIGYEESRWRAGLPSAYAWWAMLEQSGVWWSVAALVCVFAYWRRRVKLKQRLAELEAEDAAELAAARILAAEEAALARGEVDPVAGAEGPVLLPEAPAAPTEESSAPPLPPSKPTVH